jgi:hypothetical protein
MMSGMSRCFVRRVAVLIGVFASAALVAAPAAFANDDTITATATVQFSGAVDNPASCTATPSTTTASIDWGDDTTDTAGTISTSHVVSGTHTYAAKGTYFGTVTFTGGACDGDEDSFTANVNAAPPMFTQCPPVDLNNGCQFLITIANGTEVATQDPNQGPYEGAEDALIGVQNNSSSPVSQLPLAVPGSDLFGFDEDGLCDPGSTPVPSGCVPQAGAPATDCQNQGSQNLNCSFPAPAGEPAGYTEPGASGSWFSQNGYEGPTSWFSNVSADLSSGVVHFSPALQPGQSTYFSLEEPPVGTNIGVGGTAPSSPGLSPPTVKGTGASFSAFVNPNGQATTGYFQYGLDLKYSKFGGSGPDYTNSTAKQALAADFNDHLLSANVTGLVPNALYHARLVAQNGSGTTFGPDVTFFTGKLPTPSAPTLGKTFNISPVSGLVLIKLNGKFVPLTQIRQIPKNTLINAIHGTLQLITATTGGHPATDAAAKKGKKGKGGKGKVKTQTGKFGGAIFKITQAHNGLATLSLVEGAVKGGPSFAKCKGGKKAADVTASAASSKTLQLLRASAKGKFSTKGKYAAATVRGTKWTTADRCDGTQVHDVTDSVSVTDLVLHKTVILHGGQTYLAKKP